MVRKNHSRILNSSAGNGKWRLIQISVRLDFGKYLQSECWDDGDCCEIEEKAEYVHSSLKILLQIERVVKKAFGILGFISHGNAYGRCDIMA